MCSKRVVRVSTTKNSVGHIIAGNQEPAISKQHTQSKNLSNAYGSILIELAQFDALPDSAFVRLPVVKGIFSCSAATVWRWVKDAHLPSPHKLGGRISAWNVGQLRKSLNKINKAGLA